MKIIEIMFNGYFIFRKKRLVRPVHLQFFVSRSYSPYPAREEQQFSDLHKAHTHAVLYWCSTEQWIGRRAININNVGFGGDVGSYIIHAISGAPDLLPSGTREISYSFV